MLSCSCSSLRRRLGLALCVDIRIGIDLGRRRHQTERGELLQDRLVLSRVAAALGVFQRIADIFKWVCHGPDLAEPALGVCQKAAREASFPARLS